MASAGSGFVLAASMVLISTGLSRWLRPAVSAGVGSAAGDGDASHATRLTSGDASRGSSSRRARQSSVMERGVWSLERWGAPSERAVSTGRGRPVARRAAEARVSRRFGTRRR